MRIAIPVRRLLMLLLGDEWDEKRGAEKGVGKVAFGERSFSKSLRREPTVHAHCVAIHK